MFLHVVNARHIADHTVYLRFNDGTVGEADLSQSLTGPIFQPLRDVEYFRAFSIEGHTLTWPNGADFAPVYLHELVRSQAIACAPEGPARKAP
jgi:hypothetical protein